jgi:gas vesicle protein
MKTLILNPKEQFLLGAGLDVLHFESREWLNTIAFWKDEVNFFNDLLKRKDSSKKNDPDIAKMLKDLGKIHKDLFEDLEDSIQEHEGLLSRIERKEKGLSDYDYREKHKRIKNRIAVFESDFKSFKKIVFDYVKPL